MSSLFEQVPFLAGLYNPQFCPALTFQGPQVLPPGISACLGLGVDTDGTSVSFLLPPGEGISHGRQVGKCLNELLYAISFKKKSPFVAQIKDQQCPGYFEDTKSS